MKDQRLLVLSLRDHPSSRLRIGQYLPMLREDGFAVEEMSFVSPKVGLSDLRRIAKALNRTDVVFVQRIAYIPLNRLLRASKVRVVYDVDDALHLVRPAQLVPTRSPKTPKDRLVVKYREIARGSRYYGSRKRAIDQIASFADVVIVGNEFLREQLALRSGNPVVLPTCVMVDSDRVRRHQDRSPIRIGWIGLQDNLRELEPLEPALRALGDQLRGNVLLSIVSSRHYNTTAIPTEFIPWGLNTESASTLRFDIGIMPLANTPFAKGKCAFKAIHCMSFGLPVVVSPVGMNTQVVDHEVSGFFASTTREWTESLRALTGDAGLRARMGRQALVKVQEAYSADVGYRTLRGVLGSSDG